MGLAVSGEFQRFRDALALQGRVVWALVLREMRTRFGHSRLGYAWALGEPVVFILVLSALKSAAGGGVSALGTSIPVFFFTGIVPFLMFRRTTQQLGSAISANRALLNYPPVRPVDTLIARALLEIATMLVRRPADRFRLRRARPADSCQTTRCASWVRCPQPPSWALRSARSMQQ